MSRISALAMFFAFVLAMNCLAEDSTSVPTQIIKGRIVNSKTQRPVAGATVRLVGTKIGDYAGKDGYFKIKNVPPARYIIRASAVGYKSRRLNIVATSGKQEQLFIELEESYVTTDEVKVTARRNPFEPINESSLVSSTVFTIDDVERFAGSRMDPARMAQNLAGVVGADDLRNDIIIRGGSPSELLWRIDGLDVPNPNHFATQGATGGPVSILNSNVLDNSDFMTGAWSSEYGNKMSGVFDIQTRKGNFDEHEFLGQFGFNGFELGAEGPLPGKKNSFIANYRYSFLDLIEKMGINFGFSGIPRYQDGFVKTDLLSWDKNQLSFTGIFGVSSISIAPSGEDEVYTSDFALNNGTDFVSGGLTWQHLFSERSYGKALFGVVYNNYKTNLDSVTTDSADKVIDQTRMYDFESVEGYYTAKYSVHFSPNSNNLITAGVEGRLRFYDLYGEEFDPSVSNPWLMQRDGESLHTLSFVNWNWNISKSVTADFGIHSQYLEVNDKFTIEPRAALSWDFLPNHNLRAGYGIHRQSLPLLIHFAGDENEGLEFMQSSHYVLGYSYQIGLDAMLKVEGYYKDICKAPIERDEASSWSFLNAGANFGAVEGVGLEAKSVGLGRAYGADLSFRKNFSNHYYITATASYMRQQYKGSDGVWRFGAFDNVFAVNLLAGYEWVITPTFTIEFSGRYTIVGGGPYVPIDLEESRAHGETRREESEAYSVRSPNYSRTDFRIDFRENFDGFAIVSYVSAENVFNKQNVYDYQYDSNDDRIEAVSQLGFFFVGGFRIEF